MADPGAPLKQLNEAMDRYAAGDARAFDALYSLLTPRLYTFCMRLTGRRSDADDLLQETFLKLHRARASYVPGSTALPWAFAIARSVHIDRLRYRRRRPEDLGDAEAMETMETRSAQATYPSVAAHFASPESNTRARELMIIIERTLQGLPENQRSAYILIREEGLSVADAAGVLGTTTMAVKLRAHRAYEAIRAAVVAAGGGEEAR